MGPDARRGLMDVLSEARCQMGSDGYVERGPMNVGIHDTYCMRVIGSEERLGMYCTQLGNNCGEDLCDYDSVGETQ